VKKKDREERLAAITRRSNLPYGVECGDGWIPIVVALDVQIALIDPNYVVHQVKEKFGGLRYYIATSESLSDEDRTRIRDLVSYAEAICWTICEDCGREGTLRKHGWWKTMCDECYVELTAPDKEYLTKLVASSDPDRDAKAKERRDISQG